MDHFSLYIACVLGAIGVYLMIAHDRPAGRLGGVMLGLAALATVLGRLVMAGEDSAENPLPDPLFYVFAFIALGAAMRMITHQRPVYCALYFVMVVLSSAALFLLMEAEFMAFALIIVYAGAILITYLFVLMLAQQMPTEDSGEGAAVYDRVAREPLAAVFVGFLMLTLLAQVIARGSTQLPPPQRDADAFARAVIELQLQPGKMQVFLRRLAEADDAITDDARLIALDHDRAVVQLAGGEIERTVLLADAGLDDDAALEDLLPQNIESVGLALVAQYPASLELAGVILLLAMFGAVVLARKQLELSEDEKREAAGMQRLSLEAPEAPETPSGGAP